MSREGVDKYGDPLENVIYDGKCNYQEKAKQVLTADKRLIQLSAVAYFPTDIAPDLAVISGGKIIVNGAERSIYQGEKARNPDGTVNYTRLDVM